MELTVGGVGPGVAPDPEPQPARQALMAKASKAGPMTVGQADRSETILAKPARLPLSQDIFHLLVYVEAE